MSGLDAFSTRIPSRLQKKLNNDSNFGSRIPPYIPGTGRQDKKGDTQMKSDETLEIVIEELEPIVAPGIGTSPSGGLG
jgi:hypothetical protein